VASGSKDIRILGVGRGISGFRHRTTRNTGLFSPLDDRYQITGTIEPHPPRLQTYLLILRYIRPNRDAWRSRFGLSPRLFRRLTKATETELRAWDGRYDLIMLMQTLFSPGLLSMKRRYAIYTDNIHVLTARFFPAWAPLGPRDRAERIQLEQTTCRAARYVFAMSDFVRDALVDDYGCDPERVIRVGVGTNSMVRSLQGKRYDTQVALFVGIHFERKGGDVLLRAWEMVRKRLPEAELWVVGPKHRPPAAQQPGVRWHGFISDRQQLADMYRRATVFVLPSLFEPYGLVFLEAMGHGLPCIGTERGGIREAIDDGIDGLLVPAGEPEPLADALTSLLGDPEQATAMGSRGHMKVLKEHTWDRVVDRMAPYIEEASEA
jgi:glycosyltransferase involved in cell wall biosynthesis